MKTFAKITIPFDLAMPGGILYNFVYEWVLKEYRRKYDNGILTLYGLAPDVQPSFADLVAIVTNGGSFEGIKLGVQIQMSAKDTDVPAGIRGRIGYGEESVEFVRTWLEWIQAGRVDYKVKTDNSDAIFKASWDGSTLNSDELAIIHSQSYANIIEWQTLIDLANSSEYEVKD